MNTLGSGIGAGLYDLLSSRIAMTPRMVGRLALEAPLMGLIYLLVPLLWVNRLVPDEGLSRWPLTTLIGLCEGSVLSDVFQQWWGPIQSAVALAGCARRRGLVPCWYRAQSIVRSAGRVSQPDRDRHLTAMLAATSNRTLTVVSSV